MPAALHPPVTSPLSRKWADMVSNGRVAEVRSRASPGGSCPAGVAHWLKALEQSLPCAKPSCWVEKLHICTKTSQTFFLSAGQKHQAFKFMQKWQRFKWKVTEKRRVGKKHTCLLCIAALYQAAVIETPASFTGCPPSILSSGHACGAKMSLTCASWSACTSLSGLF